MDLSIFLFGVATSLVATALWQIYDRYIINRPLAYLIGDWFEIIPSSPDRMYSIGEIRYNRRSKKYAFDGINYKNNGEPVCKWESISFDIDHSARKIFYTFRASFFDALHEENYGFGVLNLKEDKNGNILPFDGHYIEANAQGVPYSHSMHKINAIIETIGISTNNLESKMDYFSRIVDAWHKSPNKAI